MKFTGKIVHGAGRGHGLGFPTINIEGVFPGLTQGVYAAWVWVAGQRFKGALNYGTQPTVGDATVRLEIFLLDFEGDLYGELVNFEVVQKLRDTQKFASPEELKTQIARDVQAVRSVL